MPSSVYEVSSKVRTLQEESNWLNALAIAVPHQKARVKRSHLEICLCLDMVIGESVSVSSESQRVPGFSVLDDIFFCERTTSNVIETQGWNFYNIFRITSAFRVWLAF